MSTRRRNALCLRARKTLQVAQLSMAVRRKEGQAARCWSEVTAQSPFPKIRRVGMVAMTLGPLPWSHVSQSIATGSSTLDVVAAAH